MTIGFPYVKTPAERDCRKSPHNVYLCGIRVGGENRNKQRSRFLPRSCGQENEDTLWVK